MVSQHFIVFYVVFRFAIVKFDLKTPGREDDDDDETKVDLANDDFTTVAKIVLDGVGGKDNVRVCRQLYHKTSSCRSKITQRLMRRRSNLQVLQVLFVHAKKDVQVIIGTKVQFVADEFKKLCK